MKLKQKKGSIYSSKNAFFFIILAFFFWALFIVYPIIYSTGLSFFDWTGLTQTPFKDFVGLDNYAKLFSDRIYLLALKNTALFTLGLIILLNIFGFGIASFLFYGKLRGSVIWRSIIFFPCMLSSLSVGFNWRNILMQNGILNNIIQRIFPSYEPIGWLMNATTPIFVIMVVSSW
jgi:ABC-type sugar transport system permease subunit